MLLEMIRVEGAQVPGYNWIAMNGNNESCLYWFCLHKRLQDRRPFETLVTRTKKDLFLALD
jgi:hypothetical protein